MKNVKIIVERISHVEERISRKADSSFSDKFRPYIFIAGIIFLALLIVGVGLFVAYKYFWGLLALGILVWLVQPRKADIPNDFYSVFISKEFSLRHRPFTSDEVPAIMREALHGTEYERTIVYQYTSKPSLEFFEGSFLDEPINLDEVGIILQKPQIDHNGKLQSIPLFFFDYKSQNAEKIVDIKGFEIMDSGWNETGQFEVFIMGDNESINVTIEPQY